MSVLTRFDLNLLTIFEAIYTRQGVSGAARQLNLSQPAISHSLAKLRATFDDRLFVRHGNGLVPTARARSLIQPIRDVLGQVESALTATAGFEPASSTRSFTIGLRPSNEAPSLAAFVIRVLAAAPGVGVTSRYLSRRSLAAALANGDLDLALDVGGLASAGVRCTALRTIAPIVAARWDHPTVHGAITLDQYLAHDHVFVSSRPIGLGPEDEALAKLGLARRIKVRCQQAMAAWEIVASSDLLCTLPRAHADMFGRLHPNQVMDFPIATGPTELSLYWHDATDADPATRWLRDLAKQHFGIGDAELPRS